VLSVELVDDRRVLAFDVRVAHVLADDGPVLALDESGLC